MRQAHGRAYQPVRMDLRDRYAEVRNRSTALIDGLTAEDCQVQSMTEASPLKWHLAHTTWFFETFVLSNLPAYAPFDPAFGYLFNSYYNSVGPMHPRAQRGLLAQPTLARVLEYRRYVDEAMLRGWRGLDATGVLDRVVLGLQHEEQHQELMLTDLMHAWSCNPLMPAYAEGAPLASRASGAEWLRIESGLRLVGAEGDAFAFDNEMPRHRVWLDAFEIASRPVTHQEYRAFIDDGGYRNPMLWLSDGWDLLRKERWERPSYWLEDLEHSFGLHGLQPIDPHAPVSHLSYYEADAFARWADRRLPTESEWEVAMDVMRAPIGGRASAVLSPVLDGERLGVGEVWEWTSSAYAAYPGFRPQAGAIGEYNGKFMCNQFVLRGGSCVTPPGHARATYRNFFPPAARWQFSGLRLARDI